MHEVFAPVKISIIDCYVRNSDVVWKMAKFSGEFSLYQQGRNLKMEAIHMSENVMEKWSM